MTSLIPKNTVFGVNTKPDRAACSSSQSRKMQSGETKNNFSDSRLGVNGPPVSVCQLTSQNFKMLHCCIFYLSLLKHQKLAAAFPSSSSESGAWRGKSNKQTKKIKPITLP